MNFFLDLTLMIGGIVFLTMVSVALISFKIDVKDLELTVMLGGINTQIYRERKENLKKINNERKKLALPVLANGPIEHIALNWRFQLLFLAIFSPVLIAIFIHVLSL